MTAMPEAKLAREVELPRDAALAGIVIAGVSKKKRYRWR